MRKYKVVISMLLVLLIIASSVVLTSASSSSNVLKAQILEEKISLELQSSLDELHEDDKVKVAVWLSDIESEKKDEAFSDKLLKEKGNISTQLYSKSILCEDSHKLRSNNLSLDDIQTLSSIRRSAYKELHVNRNNKWKNSMDDVLEGAKVIYVSNYAPVVILETSKSKLKTIASSDEVENIYTFCDWEEPYDEKPIIEKDAMVCNSSRTVDYGVWQENTNISTMRDEMAYEGRGIKIGLLENALPDINHTSGVFENSTIIAVNDDESDEHATHIAAILVGKTDDYTGIVPEAQLYCASHVRNYFEPIENLIEHDIDILSISVELGGNGEYYNTYGNYAKYLDYIVYNYSIVVCKSSGNEGGVYGIPEGAMGYNSITVGNIDDNNTITYNDDEIFGDSSYVTGVTKAYKPDVCAPGHRTGSPVKPELATDGGGGTSYATPVVAGVCAMLMEAEYSLIDRPMLVKSIIMCSANRVPNMDLTVSTGLTEALALSRRYGAGLVDATKAFSVAYEENWGYIPLVTVDQSKNPFIIDVVVTQNDIDLSKKLAVSLSWTQKVLSTSWFSNTAYPVYHHELRVYSPNGDLIARSNYQYDRKQFVYFQPSVAGTYQVKVYKSGIAQASVLTAIAYNLS